MKKLILFIFMLFSLNSTFAQFDKPVFQFGIGLVEPFDNLKGGNYYNYANSYHYINPWVDTTYNFASPYLMIDSSTLLTNYNLKTGIHLFGSAKINFDPYSIVRGVATINYSSFNTFLPSKYGNSLIFINYEPGTRPVTYDYSFYALGIGLGLEVAPLSFTNVVSPFFNTNLSFNFLGGKFTRTGPYQDSTEASFNGFRIGVNFNTGIEVKFSKQWGMVLGIKYDLGNLLLKNTETGNYIEWGSTNAGLNDEEGTIISNIYEPEGDSYKTHSVNSKKINWGTLYVGVNFYPEFGKTTTPKKK
jgi:hypothetical protein